MIILRTQKCKLPVVHQEKTYALSLCASSLQNLPVVDKNSVMNIPNRLPKTTSDKNPRFLPWVGEADLWWTGSRNVHLSLLPKGWSITAMVLEKSCLLLGSSQLHYCKEGRPSRLYSLSF